MSEIYDIGIIGAGPGGYHAAIEAAKYGKKVLLIEKNKLGGVCLNNGCIPTKSLINVTKTYYAVCNAKYLKKDAVVFDWEEVLDKQKKDIKRLYNGLSAQLRSENICIKTGVGLIDSLSENGVCIQVEGEKYLVNDLIISTGSREYIPAINGIEEAMRLGKVVNSTQILEGLGGIDKLAVIGAGVVGLEIASAYANLGTDVEIYECQQDILKYLDNEVKVEYVKALEKKGIKIYTNYVIDDISKIDADKILIATGRKPNSEDFSNIPLELCNGHIVTDRYGKTNIEHIYACGDVTTGMKLAYVAGLEGEMIARNLFAPTCEQRLCDDSVPAVVFTNPEVAWIGKSEEKCISEGIEYVKCTCSMNYSSLFSIENYRDNGLFKLIIDKQTEKIIGCHILGNGAAELVDSMQLLIAGEYTLKMVESLLIVHPSIFEVVKECIKLL